MKIDEPKTPYAKHYNPAEDYEDDDEAVRTLDTDEMMVDEMEQMRAVRSLRAKEDEIPGLSLGEPEEAVPENEFGNGSEKRERKGDKAVHVNGTVDEEHIGWSAEEKEKHRKFEEMRKKHYEMKDVANLLGHPEELDDFDDDDEMNGNAR